MPLVAVNPSVVVDPPDVVELLAVVPPVTVVA